MSTEPVPATDNLSPAKESSYTAQHPSIHNFACGPCGVTMAGDHIPLWLRALWLAVHADHDSEAAV